MPIPIPAGLKEVPWWEPEFGGNEARYVDDVLKSGYVNDGKLTEQLEKELSSRLGARHAVIVTSGTSAIFLALAGLGIGPGDEVLVPDITFIATANAVQLTGARPVFVDVELATLNIDPADARRRITPKTKALVPVHISGRAANMQALQDLAREKNLFLVEDAAEALGSKHTGKFLGTWGHAGCLSFTANKIVASGQGGAILTNDEKLYVRLKELKDQGRPKRGTGGADTHVSVGYNFKFTDIQAAVLKGQLEALDSRLAHQRHLYEVYAEELKPLKGIRLPGFAIQSGEVPLWVDAVIEKRDIVFDALAARNIHCRKFWYPLHTQKPYFEAGAKFPKSDQAAAQALWLPSSFQLPETDVRYVCQTIRQILEDS